MKALINLIIFLALLSSLELKAQTFTNVAHSAFETTKPNRRVYAVIDYNNDNFPDLFIRFWSGKAEKFTILKNDVGFYTDFGVTLKCPNSYCRFFDYDNDGFVDIAAISGDTLSIYKNLNGSSFKYISSVNRVSRPTFFPTIENGRYGIYDYDNDGDLDFLYVDSSATWSLKAIVNDYMHNSFTKKVTLVNNWPVNGTRFKLFDMDADGDMDIVGSVYTDQTAFSNTAMFLYKNNGVGNFTDVTFASGLVPGLAMGGCNIYDINQDGKLDIIRGGPDSGTPPNYRVFINQGGGIFSDKTPNYPIKSGWIYVENFTSVDFDNDNDPDYVWDHVTATGIGTNKLYKNDGTNTFTEVSAAYGINLGETVSHCCPIDNFTNSVWLDFDNDGDMDDYISREEYPGHNGNSWLMQNPLSGNYLDIRLAGCTSNREGRGATVKVKSNGKNIYQYYDGGANMYWGNSTSIFHFGLGNNTIADSVTVYWPSGIVSSLSQVQGNTKIIIEEETGICDRSIGIKNIPNNDDWNIYPNPANDKIYFNTAFKNNYSFFLINLLGEEIKRYQSNGTATFDIQDVPNGIYLLKIRFENKIVQKKLSIFH